jgi:putative membrane protein
MVGNGWKWIASVASFSGLIAIGACGGGDGAGDTTNVAGGTVAADTAAAATAPAPVAPPATGDLSTMAITGGDPEIMQFLATVDLGEIEAARLAQQQARNAQVKAFARTLITEHQQTMRRARQIARSANITIDTSMMARAGTTGTGATASATTPTTTPGTTSGVAGQLAMMHRQTMERLRGLQGAEFDSAFMNAQVMGHQQVLNVLQRAQGQAQDSTVQRHLSTATENVQEHLDRARQIQQAVMQGTGAAGDTASKARTDTGSKASSDTGRRPG